MHSLSTLLCASLCILAACDHKPATAPHVRQPDPTSQLPAANSGDTAQPAKGMASEPKTTSTSNIPRLLVGAPAPAVTFSKTFKGPTIQTLDPNQNYIVECWATWCGPCRAAFPHLSQLAKELKGKVTVIGVDVQEKWAPADIQAFVDKQGDRMSYTVVSDPDDVVWRNWLHAAGQDGIPYAFVVIQGKIA